MSKDEATTSPKDAALKLTSIEKLGIAVSDFIRKHNLMWSDALVLAWQEAEADYVDELNNAINQGSDLIRADEREACAALAQQTICDTHIPTGINIYGTRAAKAIRARGNT